MEKQSFKLLFQITKLIIFEIKYGRCGNNKNKYFSTSALVLVKNKKTWNRAGQCQKDVLNGLSFQFWRKWDKLHLKDLTQEEYNLILEDLQILKDNYNCIENKNDIDIKFDDIVELSKKDLKNN